jgi:hypothetical protein
MLLFSCHIRVSGVVLFLSVMFVNERCFLDVECLVFLLICRFQVQLYCCWPLFIGYAVHGW